MPPVHVDPTKAHTFIDGNAFQLWLEANHDAETEVWIKIHKQSSGLASITPVQAIDACLCWGWIDGVRKGLDGNSYLQRYTPRGHKSIWSRVNIENVARLTAQGAMNEPSLRQVEAAKADGRWQRAYGRAKDMPIPDDFLRAIEAEPAAKAMLVTLNARNRFAIAFRLHAMKTETGRLRKIDSFVSMLKRGETIYPQNQG